MSRMQDYPTLIYGGGNCEIAGEMHHEMQKLCKTQEGKQKIYARTYLLANSCLAMYKRFDGIKGEVSSSGLGGVYEYYCNGEDEGVERQALKMESASSPEQWNDFMETAVACFEAKEMMLVLIGQSGVDGLFVDLCSETPSYLTYSDLLSVLRRINQEHQVFFHLILDLSQMHTKVIQKHLEKEQAIKSAYLYKRKQPLDIMAFATQQQEEHTQEEWVTIKALSKDEKKRTDLAKQTLSMRQHSNEQINASVENDLKQKPYVVSQEKKQGKRMSMLEVRRYLQNIYSEPLQDEAVKQWLNEFKQSVDYYKM